MLASMERIFSLLFHTSSCHTTTANSRSRTLSPQRRHGSNKLVLLCLFLLIALYDDIVHLSIFDSRGHAGYGYTSGVSALAVSYKSLAAAGAGAGANSDGLLKLCPPGGESFANAWQITCGMRRRKKRETEGDERIKEVEGRAPQQSTPLTPTRNMTSSTTNNTTQSTTTQHSTTNGESKVAKEAAAAAAAAAIANPEPLLVNRDEHSPGSPPSDPALKGARSELAALKSSKGRRKKRGIFTHWVRKEGEPAQEIESLAEGDSQEGDYRAPSMTEMMLFCCRYGCSLRDLLPYCDPFGEWDS